jgi:hypothetical protein
MKYKQSIIRKKIQLFPNQKVRTILFGNLSEYFETFPTGFPNLKKKVIPCFLELLAS